MRFRQRLHLPLQQVTQISTDFYVEYNATKAIISLTRTPCNGACRKLIGARFFNAGIQVPNFLDPEPEEGKQLNQTDLNSPRDYDGHGSHTLSTAGGGFVQGASAFGRGKGTAKGGSPGARVASYKACYTAGCSSLDILAAIFAAVEDGVHVLSLSVGAPAADYVADPMAIGTLYAVHKGVAVVASAGNSGPQPGSVSNLAPWILTVGASTMDRNFAADAVFGNSTIKVWPSIQPCMYTVPPCAVTQLVFAVRVIYVD